MNRKIAVLTLLLSLTIVGCSPEIQPSPEPSNKDLKNAFDNAIHVLNQKTGSKISDFNIDRIEVPVNCFDDLDYFAQQFLWVYLYQDEAVRQKTFFIDCNISKRYKQLKSTKTL
jgi:hypothetical protein